MLIEVWDRRQLVPKYYRRRYNVRMTEEKDYIMRMIAQFMRVITRVLLLKDTKQYYDAVTELDNLNKMISGFSLEQIKNLGVEGFKYVYDLNKKADVEKVFCAARILKEESLILDVQDKKDEAIKSAELADELFDLIKDKPHFENIEINN
jgi:hypothetical protein